MRCCTFAAKAYKGVSIEARMPVRQHAVQGSDSAIIYGNLTQGRRDGRDNNTSRGETRRRSGWILIMDSVVVDTMDPSVGLLLFGGPGVAGATTGGGDSADHVPSRVGDGRVIGARPRMD
jgi:hypothetical protein